MISKVNKQWPDNRLRWPYRQSKSGQDTAISLQPLDFMARFLQHILPRHFARVRTFGWLHPAAKLRANRVRDACHIAQRRLFSSGLAPLRTEFPDTGDGIRIAAALLLPVRDVGLLSRLVIGSE